MNPGKERIIDKRKVREMRHEAGDTISGLHADGDDLGGADCVDALRGHGHRRQNVIHYPKNRSWVTQTPFALSLSKGWAGFVWLTQWVRV